MQFESPRTVTGRRLWLGSAGIVSVMVAVVLMVGWPGLLVGGLLVVTWVRLPPEFTYGLGQFALILGLPTTHSGATPGGVTIFVLGIGQAGLVGLLLAPPTESNHRLSRTVNGVLASAVSAGIIGGLWTITWLDSIWVVVMTSAVVGTLLVIGLQHYEYTIHKPFKDEQ